MSVLRTRLLLLALLAAAAAPAAGAALQRQVLRAGWTLSNDLGFANVSLPGVDVPSYALPVLHAAGRLADPLHRCNELELRWAALDNWTWALQFDVAEAMLQQPAILLRLGGVDAIADVALNGQVLGKVASAHRSYDLAVPPGLLGSTANNLSITVWSAAEHAQRQAAAYPYPVPRVKQLGSLPAYNFVRKAASDYGWDWGPAFAPAGIPGAVELLGYSTAVLTGISVRQQHRSNGSVLLTVDATLLLGQRGRRGRLALTAASRSGEQRWSRTQAVELPAAGFVDRSGSVSNTQEACEPGPGPAARCGRGPATHSERVALELAPPYHLWWPHELGHPHLYELSCTFQPDPEPEQDGLADEPPPPPEEPPPSSEIRRRVGLRTVELVRRSITRGGRPAGETFFFKVNGAPIFAKGANAIPLDVFESEVDEHRLRQLVLDAKSANMNMLRVWGGGRYMQDAFYEACDEEGMLVWQEAMFACAMYPRDEAVLQEVREEVLRQGARVNGHACIALWGGNNENEAAFDWVPGVAANPKLYAVDFSTLFVDTVRKALLEVDPSIVYVDTSPSNGLLSTEPYAKRWGSTNDPNYGDVHFYTYSEDVFDPEIYPRAKFVSEWGFMSLPSFPVYKKATTPGDWSLNAAATQFWMRHANGFQELLAQMQRHYLHSSEPLVAGGFLPIPNVVKAGCQAGRSMQADDTEARRFKAAIYLSQHQQATAYETAVGRWRRLKSDPEAQTQGALYWQLNDIWQGPSWSGMDYGGSWRQLHYRASHFFRPVAVTLHLADRDAGTVQASVVNDLAVAVLGELRIDAIPYAADDEAQVVNLLRAARVEVPASAAGPAWSDSLAAVRGLRPSEFLLRARFCPTATAGGSDRLPSPFGARREGAASWQPVKAACSGAGATGAAPLMAECAAARRLLRCSESLLFPTEFKDAALVPADVVVSDVQPSALGAADIGLGMGSSAGWVLARGAAGASAAAGPGSAPSTESHLRSLAVRLAADGVAVGVVLESQHAGVFSDNGFLLLPWESGRTVHFVPRDGWEAGTDGREAAQRFKRELSVSWLQDAMQLQDIVSIGGPLRSGAQPVWQGAVAMAAVAFAFGDCLLEALLLAALP